MILPNMDKEKAETWLASMGIDGTSPYNNITHSAGIFETFIRYDISYENSQTQYIYIYISTHI